MIRPKPKTVLPLLLAALLAPGLFCSCETPGLFAVAPTQIADKVWTFSQSHPDGFTLNVFTMSEPKEGIAVSYAATQNSHSREQLDRVVEHAIRHDGYVGGWRNGDNGLYYFDSTRLFPEDALFPCDQFGHQAPGSDDEIHNFCALKYNTTFDQLAKIEVNGPGADPIYVFLKTARPKDDATDEAIAGLRDLLKKHNLAGAEAPGDIEWNFTKFLIDKDGNVVKRFHPTTAPETIDAEIAALL